MRATEEAGVDGVNMIESHMSLKTDPGLVGFTKKKKKGLTQVCTVYFRAKRVKVSAQTTVARLSNERKELKSSPDAIVFAEQHD